MTLSPADPPEARDMNDRLPAPAPPASPDREDPGVIAIRG
jgi:hypothetical protein